MPVFIATKGAGHTFAQTTITTTAQAHTHKYLTDGLIEEPLPSPAVEKKKLFFVILELRIEVI